MELTYLLSPSTSLRRREEFAIRDSRRTKRRKVQPFKCGRTSRGSKLLSVERAILVHSMPRNALKRSSSLSFFYLSGRRTLGSIRSVRSTAVLNSLMAVIRELPFAYSRTLTLLAAMPLFRC